MGALTCHDEQVTFESGSDAEGLFGVDSEAGRTAAAVDWSATALGPVNGWAPALRTGVRAMMAAQVPMLLLWGSELIQIYNDANRVILGDKHPAAMGQPVRLSFPETWAYTQPLLDDVLRGVSVFRDDQLLLLRRAGYLEETHWRFSWSPVPGDAGAPGGVLAIAQDRTFEIVGRRRLDLLHRLATVGLRGASSAHVVRRVVGALREVRETVPFAAVYLASEQSPILELAGGYGARRGTRALPRQIEPSSDHPYRQAWREAEQRDIPAPRARLEPGPIGPSTPTTLRVYPLGASTGHPTGVLVLGLNPYRTPDSRYLEFLTVAAEHIDSLLERARRAERDALEAKRLVRVDAARTRFYQNLGHEFRTPLTLVRLATSQLRPQLTAPEDQANLSTIERATAQVNLLVEGALAFSQAGPVLAAPRPARVDLTATTGLVVGMFRSAILGAGLTLELDLEPVGEVAIDPEAWTRILANLMSNAVKYTPEGGTIAVRLHRVDARIRLVVQDSGIGIAAQDRWRLTERFQRGSHARTLPEGGLGIGLAIVAELVSVMDGTLEIAGEVGRGSVFTVSVPAAPLPPEPGPGARPGDRMPSPLLAGLPAPAEALAGAAETRSVLVIEDDVDLLGYLEATLVGAGWRVHAVTDPAAARPGGGDPDVVVSDVVLQGKSGLDVVRDLRAAGSTTPVVLLSARAGLEDVIEGLMCGADDYITKPFEPTELVARLDVLHRMARRHEQDLEQAATRIGNLESALGSNRRIGFAIGILMATERITEDQAFARLREASNRRNLRLPDVADQVVQTGWLRDPEPTEPTAPPRRRSTAASGPQTPGTRDPRSGGS